MTLVTFAHRHAAPLLVMAVCACGPRAAGVVPAPAPSPATPDATVTQFLAAVNAADLDRMAGLWGDERGASNVTNRIPEGERRRRLEIMQRLLASDQHRVVAAREEGARRVLDVEMVRGGRRFTVPFTLVTARGGGWLILEIGLEAAMPAPQPRGN